MKSGERKRRDERSNVVNRRVWSDGNSGNMRRNRICRIHDNDSIHRGNSNINNIYSDDSE